MDFLDRTYLLDKLLYLGLIHCNATNILTCFFFFNFYVGMQTSIPVSQSLLLGSHQNKCTTEDISVENMLKPASSQERVLLPKPQIPCIHDPHQPLQFVGIAPQVANQNLGIVQRQMDASVSDICLLSHQQGSCGSLGTSCDHIDHATGERIILSNTEEAGKAILHHHTIPGNIGNVAELQNKMSIDADTGNSHSNVFPGIGPSELPCELPVATVNKLPSLVAVDLPSLVHSEASSVGSNYLQDQVFVENSNGYNKTVPVNGSQAMVSSVEPRGFSLIDFISSNSTERTTSDVFPADSNTGSKKRNLSSGCEHLSRGKTVEDGQAALLENILGLPVENEGSLTLPLTPKGSSGSGYGLGLDIDEFLNSEDGQKM